MSTPAATGTGEEPDLSNLSPSRKEEFARTYAIPLGTRYRIRLRLHARGRAASAEVVPGPVQGRGTPRVR